MFDRAFGIFSCFCFSSSSAAAATAAAAAAALRTAGWSCSVFIFYSNSFAKAIWWWMLYRTLRKVTYEYEKKHVRCVGVYSGILVMYRCVRYVLRADRVDSGCTVFRFQKLNRKFAYCCIRTCSIVLSASSPLSAFLLLLLLLLLLLVVLLPSVRIVYKFFFFIFRLMRYTDVWFFHSRAFCFRVNRLFHN